MTSYGDSTTCGANALREDWKTAAAAKLKGGA